MDLGNYNLYYKNGFSVLISNTVKSPYFGDQNLLNFDTLNLKWLKWFSFDENKIWNTFGIETVPLKSSVHELAIDKRYEGPPCI